MNRIAPAMRLADAAFAQFLIKASVASRKILQIDFVPSSWTEGAHVYIAPLPQP